ncbi:MAG: 50S ribosomal protein L25/general stress protein Ctc [Pseudomonadales bacterium]|nr:50S ribosomal protein L25/general stress protein Ctc [Pseudomonadales bacterium]
MSNEFQLNAEIRTDVGKGASRRLRRLADKVPAILYGADKEPLMLTLTHKDFIKALENEAFYSHIITIKHDNGEEQAILKDLQRHPAKIKILHADFLRVSKDVKIQVKVPLHFTNEESCVGVKLGGGRISHAMTELEISCLPADLPEFIEIDMADYDIGAHIHISDIKLGAGIESVALSYGEDHDLQVAAVVAGKTVEEEDEGAPTPPEGEDEGETAEDS